MAARGKFNNRSKCAAFQRKANVIAGNVLGAFLALDAIDPTAGCRTPRTCGRAGCSRLSRGDADSLITEAPTALRKIKRRGDAFSEVLTLKQRLPTTDAAG